MPTTYTHGIQKIKASDLNRPLTSSKQYYTTYTL